MRARNLKPQLFGNDLLATSDPLFTVVFAGLWCFCDREGRCEDRPSKIHLAVNPGRAYERTIEALDWLASNNFIVRYEVDRCGYLAIPKFSKHQNPHYREPPSTCPPPLMMGDEARGFDPNEPPSSPGQLTDQASLIGGEAPGQPRAPPGLNGGEARLIPDSGFRIPDSSPPTPPRSRGAVAPRRSSRKRELERTSEQAWMSALEAIEHVGTADWGQIDNKLGPNIAAAIAAAGGHKSIKDRTQFNTRAKEKAFRMKIEQLIQTTASEGVSQS